MALVLAKEGFRLSLTGDWAQAHWFKRFSEEPDNPLVIRACREQSKLLPLDWLIDTIGIMRIPIFSKPGRDLAGLWENVGNESRPGTGRFFERYSEIKQCFDLWLFRKV